MNVRRVKFSYYIISSLYTLSASFIWGINTLFLLDAGLDILQVFIANSLFTASMTLFEIPTGVIADTKGRRYSFLLSIAVLLIGTLGYLFSSIYTWGLAAFSLFSVILGLGFTFYSGAVEAWVVDELHHLGYKGNLDTLFSRSASASGIAMLIGTLTGGFVGTVDLILPYILRAGALVLLFFFSLFFMKELGFKTPLERETFFTSVKRITGESIEFGWRQKSLRLFMLVNLFQSMFMMWGFYASQPYLLDLINKPEAVWVSGMVAAGLALAQVLGNSLVSPLVNQLKRRTTLLLITIAVPGVSAVIIGVTGNFWVAISALGILMASMGVFMPVKQGYMHQLIPKEQRATVVSFDSLVGNIGGIGGQPGLGYISKTFSIGRAYITGSIALFLGIPFIVKLRDRNDMADRTSQE